VDACPISPANDSSSPHLQGIDPSAEGLANGDSANAPKAAGAPPVDLAQSFRSRGVQGSIAIGNLAELLESEDELTRFTAAKVMFRVEDSFNMLDSLMPALLPALFDSWTWSVSCSCDTPWRSIQSLL